MTAEVLVLAIEVAAVHNLVLLEILAEEVQVDTVEVDWIPLELELDG